MKRNLEKHLMNEFKATGPRMSKSIKKIKQDDEQKH